MSFTLVAVRVIARTLRNAQSLSCYECQSLVIVITIPPAVAALKKGSLRYLRESFSSIPPPGEIRPWQSLPRNFHHRDNRVTSKLWNIDGKAVSSLTLLRMFVLTRSTKHKVKVGNQIFHLFISEAHTIKLLKLYYQVLFRTVFFSFLTAKSRDAALQDRSRPICFYTMRKAQICLTGRLFLPRFLNEDREPGDRRDFIIKFRVHLRCTAATINCKRVHARGYCRPSGSSGVRSAPTRGCLLINEARARAMCMTWIANNVGKTSLCAKGPELLSSLYESWWYGILIRGEMCKMAV